MVYFSWLRYPLSKANRRKKKDTKTAYCSWYGVTLCASNSWWDYQHNA